MQRCCGRTENGNEFGLTVVHQVGEWTAANGINITDSVAFYDAGSMNVTLVVTTNLVSRVARSYSRTGKQTTLQQQLNP